MLGETHLKPNIGVCPPEYQNPSGKAFDAWFGSPPIPPFIMWNGKFVGSDTKVLEIFAKKFNFSTKLRKSVESHIKSVMNYEFYATYKNI